MIQVRLAEAEDVQCTFVWSNDPLVREMSFHSQPISWEEHQAWFTGKLDDPNSLILIAEYLEKNSWVPVGQVRFDPSGVISIALDEAFRGRGIAAGILQKSLDYYEQIRPNNSELIAYIKSQNVASINLFTRADFVLVEETIVADQPCLKFVLNWARN